jgi:hypothetical protein
VTDEERRLAWVQFYVAATIRPSKDSVFEDAIKDDAARADRMLAEWDKRFGVRGQLL